MKTKFTDRIKELNKAMIEEIQEYFAANQILRIKLCYSISSGEDSYNHITPFGAELVIKDEVWNNISLDSFSVEELDAILVQLNPKKYEVITRLEKRQEECKHPSDRIRENLAGGRFDECLDCGKTWG